MDSEIAPLKSSIDANDWSSTLNVATSALHGAVTKAAFAAGAACLRDQANALERLAGCRTPFDVWTCQLDLAQKMSSNCLLEASEVFDVFRPNGGSTTVVD
jgi:hypothetical protein